jgi:hypothetical protein
MMQYYQTPNLISQGVPQLPPANKWVGRSIVIIVLALVAMVIVFPSNDLKNTIGIPTTCVLGVTGTAANVELDGVGASGLCAPGAQDISKWYVMDNPQGVELCAGDVTDSNGHRFHATIRDEGLFDVVGRAYCNLLVNGGLMR